MVRRVIRPCPLWTAKWLIGTCCQGRASKGVEQGLTVLLDRQHELTATAVDQVRGGLDRM
jgi:hypothetical protein